MEPLIGLHADIWSAFTEMIATFFLKNISLAKHREKYFSAFVVLFGFIF